MVGLEASHGCYCIFTLVEARVNLLGLHNVTMLETGKNQTTLCMKYP